MLGRSHGILNYVNIRVVLAMILKSNRVSARQQEAEHVVHRIMCTLQIEAHPKETHYNGV